LVGIEPFDELDLDVWRQVQAVNVESALLLTRAFAPGMRERGFGRVIFIVSNTFWSPPGAHMLAYVASKGALVGMARTLAVGLGRDGIAVTAVAPGLTHTPATVNIPAAEFADAEAHQALPRPLTPDDTAATGAMLARDGNRRAHRPDPHHGRRTRPPLKPRQPNTQEEQPVHVTEIPVSTTGLPVGTWQLDPTHSSAAFAVKHMAVATFAGGARRSPPRSPSTRTRRSWSGRSTPARSWSRTRTSRATSGRPTSSTSSATRDHVPCGLAAPRGR
jgi:hypothetical protein